MGLLLRPVGEKMPRAAGKGEGEVRGMAPRVYGTLNRQRENARSSPLSLSLSLSLASLARASFRHYKLSEDTLAQICKADNSARRVGRDEGSGDGAGGGGAGDRETRVERVAGTVVGASNYSAINNPRVTRVIGPLSARPPRRSLARLPSFLATNQPSAHPL